MVSGEVTCQLAAALAVYKTMSDAQGGATFTCERCTKQVTKKNAARHFRTSRCINVSTDQQRIIAQRVVKRERDREYQRARRAARLTAQPSEPTSMIDVESQYILHGNRVYCA